MSLKIVLLASACLAYVGTSFGLCGGIWKITVPWALDAGDPVGIEYLRKPDFRDWQLAALLERVVAESRKPEPRLGLMLSTLRLNKGGFVAEARRLNLPVRLVSVVEPSHWKRDRDFAALANDLAGADYVLLPQGEIRDVQPFPKARTMLESEPSLRRMLEQVTRVTLPNGQIIRLMRVK